MTDFRALLVTHQDCSGLLRSRIIPAARADAACRQGISVGRAAAALLTFDDGVATVEGFDPLTGDLRAVADSSRTVVIDPAAGLAWAPLVLLEADGTPAEVCPRSSLQALVAKAEQQHGLRFLTGVELEFTVLRADASTGGSAPLYAHDGPAYGARAAIDLEPFILDLIEDLGAADVEIEIVHPEFARGQFEVVLAPKDPVRTADNVVLAKLVIDRVARRHQLVPSFAPLVSEDMAGNGCHTHLSASDQHGNVFHEAGTRWGMSTRAEHIVAGVLEALAEGTALVAGSATSYLRLSPGRWAGGAICWGIRNREAALRYLPVAEAAEGHKANVELKTPDAMSNHYLVGAFLVGAALRGLEQQSTLPPPVVGDPALLGEHERSEHRARPFPPDLGAALAELGSSAALREVLGDVMVDVYCAVRSAEWEQHGSQPVAEQLAASLLRY